MLEATLARAAIRSASMDRAALLLGLLILERLYLALPLIAVEIHTSAALPYRAIRLGNTTVLEPRLLAGDGLQIMAMLRYWALRPTQAEMSIRLAGAIALI